jgi:hypothetical protein
MAPEPGKANCIGLMREARQIFLRNGAYQWHLLEHLRQPNNFAWKLWRPLGRSTCC